MHWDISENLLNKLDKELAVNPKSLRVLNSTSFLMKTKSDYRVCERGSMGRVIDSMFNQHS